MGEKEHYCEILEPKIYEGIPIRLQHRFTLTRNIKITIFEKTLFQNFIPFLKIHIVPKNQ